MISTQTARDLINRAFRICNVTSSGNPDPSAEDSDSALLILNGMVDSWNADRLNIFTVKVIPDLPLVSPRQTYTIGEGGTADFSYPRPERIEWANILIPGDPTVRYPLALIDKNRWLALSIRSIGPTIPNVLYYQPDYPDGQINLWGFPPDGYLLEIQYWLALTQFDDLDVTFTFPPGYWEMMAYSLAERIALEWGLKEGRDDIVRMAREARGKVQSLNMNPIPAAYNDATGTATRRGLVGDKTQFFAPTQWYKQ